MQFNTLFFLVVASCLCLALANVAYENCCLKYVTSMSDAALKNAVNYRRQVPDGGCNIPAIAFLMRKGRVFCGNPKDTWVKMLIKKIDGKTPRKHSRQGNRG